MKAIDPKFGQELRRLREAKGISQRKLGEMIGLASGYVSRIERAEFKPPSEEKIVAMADALGANRDYLLSLSGKVSSDVKDAVTDNPETMSEAVRSFEGMGDWAGIALIILALFVLFSSDENKEDVVKKKVGKLMLDLRKEAEKLPDAKQLEMIGHIKDFMNSWEDDVKQR